MGEHHPALSPQDAQALSERVAEAMYARDGASQGLGITLVRVAPGRAELTRPVVAS